MATQLFRSKSCGIARSSGMDSSPSTPSLYLTDDEEEQDEDECTPISTPFIVPGWGESSGRDQQQQNQFPLLEILVAALKKSLITCSVETEDLCSVDIGWPTDVRHVSHVTFDRFNGFLGLPVEFEPDLPKKVPSASVSVFGVSPISMHCSYDYRGNSVPVILLMMQRRLYSGGGLQAEGIFRINAENSQEEYVRDQLNKGIVPHGIDVHCLAGLIKTWFRELPSGVLDSLTPEQVMHCNTEEECTQLVKLLQPTDAALLDWAINLMTDVVQQEHHNKMNARNIAMVFAPNMTQMADPLTALIHAVQVMNFLKTLVVKTLREREESPSPRLNQVGDIGSHKKIIDVCAHNEEPILDNYDSGPTKDRPETDLDERLWSIDKKRENDEEHEPISKNTTPVNCDMGTTDNVYRGGYNSGEGEGLLDKFNLRKGVKKLCRHPVFQFSKPIKKSRNLGFVNPREGGGEAWA